MTDRAPERAASSLAREHCQPVRGGTSAFSHFEIEELAVELDERWHINDDELRRDFVTGEFGDAFALATRIALLAQAQGHHPEMAISWGRLTVRLTTLAAHGLTRNDFILAARIDALPGT
ncbi:MAG: 4a-hydroxytetrahydrobiopterin dehydratase [Candidatus Limnocylindrales bacterium]